MAAFSPDASCMVASLCTWHVHHDQAREAISGRLERGDALVVAAHALVETYAVLTRLPAPFRLAPADASALLEANFLGPARVLALDASAYRRLLRRAPLDGITGGRTYDAVIAASLLKAVPATLLTFNARHFLAFSSQGLDVVVPGEHGVG
jgi:predicted nucleic acid-binding protein